MSMRERWDALVDAGADRVEDPDRKKLVRILNGIFFFSLGVILVAFVLNLVALAAGAFPNTDEGLRFILPMLLLGAAVSICWWLNRRGWSLVSFTSLTVTVTISTLYYCHQQGDLGLHYAFLSFAVFAVAVLRDRRLVTGFILFNLAWLVALSLYLPTAAPVLEFSGGLRTLAVLINLIVVAGTILGTAFHQRAENRRSEGLLEERKKAAEAAADERRLADAVFRNTTEGIIVTDAAGTILSVNEAFTEITGYTADEALGENPRILKSDRHDAEHYETMWETISRVGQWKGDFWNLRKGGELYLQESSINRVLDDTGRIQAYVAIISDVTERFHAQERIKHMASHDGLTDLPNRALFADRLGTAVALARRQKTTVAVLFIDLDGFKAVNDTHGHDAGDEVLVEVARRLTTGLRASDTLARFGGDEFAVLLPAPPDPEGAGIVARKIIEWLSEPIQLTDATARIGASIGIAMYPEHGEAADGLMKRADEAMYVVKKRGKNDFHFSGGDS